MKSPSALLRAVVVAAAGFLLFDCDSGGGGVLADLQIEKTGPDETARGTTITYTIVVSNEGELPADDVTVTDPTPAGLIFESNEGDCTTTYPCFLGSLGSGGSLAIISTYTIPDDYSGPEPILNRADVDGTFTDDEGNDVTDERSSNSSSAASTPLDGASTTTSSSSTSTTEPLATTTTEATVTTTSTTETSTSTTSSTTTTTTLAGCPPVASLNNVVFNEIYTCIQKFTGSPFFCADQDEGDVLKFKHLGSGTYEVRDVPDNGFLYNGTLSCKTFVWTATSPDGYTESGTWTFSADGTSFSGSSSYVANNGTYNGSCRETGARSPTIPPDPPTLPPCF